jgi:hypothetical protein
LVEWIEVAPAAPFFQTVSGQPWMPIGHNEAINWPGLVGLFRQRDLAAPARYLEDLAAHGVTCLRLMLEYCHTEHRYFEQPAGIFKPAMLRLWDDLFGLCEKYGLRILLTPFDTFWMWRRWKRHPYNRANGGPCNAPQELLTCAFTREAIKARFEFAIRRWAGSGVLFAWDLWNEIHPAQARNSAEAFDCFIQDIGSFIRNTERRLYGRSHPQTVSVFGPHVVLDRLRISDAIFRHHSLDFASTHFYEEGTIDDPRNTVDAAISTGRLMREALAEIRDNRPFFDSEHGPIHTYKDRHKTLPETFDDEYFRHMQWAHFASGGAGGGMRWPNRNPHTLTRGMRRAQNGLSRFLPLIDWATFQRHNWNAEVRVSRPNLAAFASGGAGQALLWLLRRDTIAKNGQLDPEAMPVTTNVSLPEMPSGTYRVVVWDTGAAMPVAQFEKQHSGGRLQFETPPFRRDLALAIRRI